MKVNQAAFETGQLAERLVQGYFTHTAAIAVAKQPQAEGPSSRSFPSVTMTMRNNFCLVLPCREPSKRPGSNCALHKASATQ